MNELAILEHETSVRGSRPRTVCELTLVFIDGLSAERDAFIRGLQHIVREVATQQHVNYLGPSTGLVRS